MKDVTCAALPTTAAELLAQVAASAVSHPGVDIDCYGVGAGLAAFEARVAARLGMARGEFMISGIMAQQCALAAAQRAHHKTDDDAAFVPPTTDTVALHASSHLLVHERDAFRALLRLDCVVMCGDALDTPLTAAHVATALADDADNNIFSVVVELPQREAGGAAPAWADLVDISAQCRARSPRVHLHLDGARLWEVQPFYGKSLADICALFDSAYVSFYKGFVIALVFTVYPCFSPLPYVT
jgi:threonine aldolase